MRCAGLATRSAATLNQKEQSYARTLGVLAGLVVIQADPCKRSGDHSISRTLVRGLQLGQFQDKSCSLTSSRLAFLGYYSLASATQHTVEMKHYYDEHAH